jgi:uncharacterized membrane protein YccC
VNTPVLCSVMLTGWITFCLYLSLLVRTSRAYAFVLAGYTASLIGFPAVFDPGSIFNIAILRVQEIMIGIFCAALIHRYVLPARISGLFNNKLSQTLRSARLKIADTRQANPMSIQIVFIWRWRCSSCRVSATISLMTLPLRRRSARQEKPSMTGWHVC